MDAAKKHRDQYDPAAAKQRLREAVTGDRERAALRKARGKPPAKPKHVHRYSRFTGTCSCGKHGRAW